MELTVYGEIGSWPNDLGTIRNVLKKANDTEDIILRVNSPGGGVIEGFAIAHLLSSMPNRVVAYIDGWAASMASILVMVADEIHAPENAWMMIHRPWVGVAGDSDEMRKMADILDEMEKQSIDMYMRKANVSREELTKMIYDETWLSAQAAYDIGLVTHLEASMEMAACWDVENRPHTAPEAAVAAITKGASQMNLMEWLKDKFASSENVEEVFSELANAEKFAAMVGEIEAFKAQVAAVEAERDEAKAEVEQLKAATSEIDEAHTTAIAEITAKVVEAEEAKAELQAKHDSLMGGMKKPEDKPVAKGSKFPATSHYLELVKQLTEECGGDVEAATIKAKTEYAEDFAAMLAEHPARKEA